MYIAEIETREQQRSEREAAYRAKHANFLRKISLLCTGHGSDTWDRLAADLLCDFKDPSTREIALVDAGVAKRNQV